MAALSEQNESLQILRIPRADMGNIVYFEKGEEISYHGKMYDVKEMSMDEDCIVFLCIQDEVETNLHVSLDNHIQRNIDTKSAPGKKQHNLSKTLSNYYISSGGNPLLRSSDRIIYYTRYFPVITFVASVSSPPPKALFS